MATQKDKPDEGTEASHPKVADDPEGDGEWDSIELPDPDIDWEKVYKCAADPHAIDYYKDEGLVEQPIEDDWTNVTQIPEELRREKRGPRVLSTQNPAGLGDKTKRRLAKQRNVKEGSQQTTTERSSTDDATADGAKKAAGAGAGDVADKPAPATDTTTSATAAGGKGRLADGWIRAVLSHFSPSSSFLEARRQDPKRYSSIFE